MANNKKYEMLYALRDELNALLGEDETTAETTAEVAEADYDDKSFNELKKLCKSKGLSAKGNREELIARLSGDESSEEEEPVEEKPKRGRKKKSEPEPEEEEDSDDEDESDSSDEDEDEDDEDEEDEEEEEDIQSQVEAATEDMSLEELAEFCKDNGLSPRGKRPALISRIVKAVEAGDIELADDDDEDEDEEEAEPPKKSNKEETEDEDSPEVSEERAAALKAYKKDTEASFKKGELERDDLVEFLCDFYDKDKKTYKKASDKEILSMYIEASSNLIDDDGDIVEEGAYTVNGVPYCCGRPLSYDEDEEQYMCEHCGNSYEADED